MKRSKALAPIFSGGLFSPAKKLAAGFTLIELIISSLIVFFVAAAVYGVFFGGINAWKRAEDIKSYERDLRLISGKMTAELRNAFKCSAIPFEGNSDFVAFANVAEIFYSEEAPSHEIGRVSYFLNEENALCRGWQSYEDIFLDGEIADPEELVEGVVRLEFSYLGIDGDSGEYKWTSVWPEIGYEEQGGGAEDQASNDEEGPANEANIPRAVKIELDIKRESEKNRFSGRQAHSGETGLGLLRLTKTIVLPLGCIPEDIEEKGGP